MWTRIGLWITLLLPAVGACSEPAPSEPSIQAPPPATAMTRMITSVVQEGEVITLRGTGFGAKTPAAPYRWDDFESGTPGKRLAGEASGGWYTWSITEGRWPVYSREMARHPGAQSAFQDFTGGNYNSTIGLTDLPGGPVYLSGWFYLTTSGAPSRNVKLLQMRPGELTDASWECRIDQYPNTDSGHQYVTDCDGSTVLENNWEIGGEMFLGGWHRLESWLDQGTPGGGDGVWTVWVDGRLWTQVRGTLMSHACPLHRLWLGFYFATDTGSPRPEARRWWDELYVDFSPRRVEIGDASTWGACSHREIQVPRSWSDAEIEVLLNPGAFREGEQVYLYVADENGALDTDGYPIILGDIPSAE